MTDTFDELRIIGEDADGLPSTDRAVILKAADELESALKLLVATQASLIESQQHRLALMDRLSEVKKAKPHLFRITYDGPITAKWGYGVLKI